MFDGFFSMAVATKYIQMFKYHFFIIYTDTLYNNIINAPVLYTAIVLPRYYKA